MRAAVLYEYNTPLIIQDLELDDPASGEVLVKMMASGDCHSDWHVVKGDGVKGHWLRYAASGQRGITRKHPAPAEAARGQAA